MAGRFEALVVLATVLALAGDGGYCRDFDILGGKLRCGGSVVMVVALPEVCFVIVRGPYHCCEEHCHGCEC